MCKFCNTEYLSLVFDLHEHNNTLVYREHHFCYHCGKHYDSKLLDFTTKKEYQEPTNSFEIKGGIGNHVLNKYYIQGCRNTSLYKLHQGEFILENTDVLGNWRNISYQMLNV